MLWIPALKQRAVDPAIEKRKHYKRVRPPDTAIYEEGTTKPKLIVKVYGTTDQNSFT
jgi:hypothetical protein